MAVLGINDGHTISGPGTGAVGIIKESEHTRLVGAELRRLLEERGQQVVNCTVDHANTTAEGLALIVQQANREDLDWFIAIHFNGGGGRGVEVYTYEGRQFEDAIEVCKNIENLGFKNRGVKAGTGLYVIRKTKAKSMLIEVCFVDTEDAAHYLNIGHNVIAKAIADALVDYVQPVAIDKQPAIDNKVLELQATLNKLKITDGKGNKLAEDGLLGNCTKDAVKRIQSICGLAVDGVVGEQTWNVINQILSKPLLKVGCTGIAVRYLQYRVGASYDGDFGWGTNRLVAIWQGQNKLTQDGIVGNNTWSKLIG